MKNIFLTALCSIALLSFSACSEKADSTNETTQQKCEAGKCSGDMNKKTTEKKCSADAKCGEGKCG